MVYFPLNINEELADLLRSATELNGLLNNYVKEHFKDLDYQDWHCLLYTSDAADE